MLLLTTQYWILHNIKWKYDSLQPKFCTNIVAIFVATVQPRKSTTESYYQRKPHKLATHLKMPGGSISYGAIVCGQG